MKGFDFDGTLYRGDSTLDFYLFAVQKQPRCLHALPAQLKGAALFGAKHIDRDEFKERFYRFLGYLTDVGSLVDDFWETHGNKVNGLVMDEAAAGDLVISASPAFLLKPFCDRMGLELIASEVDETTGALLGPNCRGEEKVRRFREIYGDLVLDEFYTDSPTDAPMATCAKTSFMVDGTTIRPFDNTL